MHIVRRVTRDTTGGKRRYAPRLPVEQRREHLLDAALAVLVRDGYDKVTIEAIAREADVTRPVVYSAYDGLEPLLIALLDRTQRRGLAAVIHLMPADGITGPVDQWLSDMLDQLLDLVQKDPATWRPILGLTRNAPEVVRDRIEATRDLVRGYLGDAIQSGLERRGGPMLDAEVLAHMAMVVGEEFMRLVLADPQRYPKDRLMATFAGLLATRFLDAE